MKKKQTNLDGFQTVLAFFIEKNGRKFGAKKMLADSLGVSRAVADIWEKRGIPAKYIPKLVKITGLRPEDILPEYFA